MAGLADLGRDDVDIDGKEPALLDRSDDGVDGCFAIAIGHGRHRVLDLVGALLVAALELQRVERGLVVIAAPRCGGRRPCRGSGAGRHRRRAFRHGHRKVGSSLPDGRPCGHSRRPAARYCRSRAPHSPTHHWCGSCHCPRSGPSRSRTSCGDACRLPWAWRSIRRP